MEDGENVTEHLNTFNRCIAALHKVHMVYSTKDEALMLLASLCPSYEHLQKMLIIGKGTLNFEEVVQDLVPHRLAQNSRDNSQDVGLLTRTRKRGHTSKHKGKKGNVRNSKFKDNEESFKYGFTDHWKQVCLIWK